MRSRRQQRPADQRRRGHNSATAAASPHTPNGARTPISATPPPGEQRDVRAEMLIGWATPVCATSPVSALDRGTWSPVTSAARMPALRAYRGVPSATRAMMASQTDCRACSTQELPPGWRQPLRQHPEGQRARSRWRANPAPKSQSSKGRNHYGFRLPCLPEP